MAIGEKSILFSILFQFFFLPCSAQDNKIISLKKIKSSDGLSSYFITKIIKDTYGFFWIGTQEGLDRYDGKHFEVFNNQADEMHHIGSSFISDIVEDKKRSMIYALTSYGDISEIDVKTAVVKRRIFLDDKGQSLSVKWLRCLYLQEDVLWIGTSKGFYAYDLRKNCYLKVTSVRSFDFHVFNVAKISGDGRGGICLFCDGYGLLLIDKKLNVITGLECLDFCKNNGLRQRKLLYWDVCYQKDTLYAATSKGLQVFNISGGRIVHLPANNSSFLDSSEIYCITFSSPNILWASANGNFYSYDLRKNRSTIYREESREDDWSSLVYHIYYDKDDNKIWIGTQAGLASFFNQASPFVPVYKSMDSEVKIKHAYSLLPNGDTSIYCGDENGIYYINRRTREISKIDTSGFNSMLFVDWRQNVFVSNRKGVFILYNRRLENVTHKFPCLKVLANDQLDGGMQYDDSLIIFSSFLQKGLYVWNVNSNKVATYQNDSLIHTIKELTVINGIFKSKRSVLFILTEKSIIEFNPITRNYKTYALEKADKNGIYGNFMDMCETDDSYWIATYGSGLIQADKNFNVKRIYSTRNQLCNNCIYKVFAINKDLVVATTNNGLAVINYTNGIIKNYYKADGLHASEFEQYCGIVHDGKIYAGGLNGFTIIDPKYFTTNTTPPKFYFTNIKTQTDNITLDTSNLEMQQLKIPRDWLQTNISFVGLNYSNPERVTYQYRIKQKSNKWSDPSTQNFVSLMGLPPGTYTLEVKAANEDGVWSSPKQLTLIFLPKWYQTLWFDFAVAMAVLALFYAFYWYRIKQIHKQQQIRVNIASDLHDDIGSALNTVKVFTHLAKRDVNKEEHINQIEESLTQATTGLRDMIWILDDTQDTLQEIVERIKKFALPVAMAHGITLECINLAEKSEQGVSKTKKRNLMLIAKEAINNSIKYSGCKNIQVIINQTGKKVSLIVKDDGRGFNKLTSPKGNGLGNIQYRAKQINAVAEIISSEGAGTIIKVVQR